MSEGEAACPPGRWGRLLADLGGRPRGPRFRPAAEWLAPLALLAAATLLIRATDFDAGAQRWIHRAGGGAWTFGEHPFWHGLYEWGTWPAYLVAVGSLVALALSWRLPSLARWRRIFAYLLAAGLMGPVLITNILLKGYWGRPRPRETNEFGGSSAFEPVLSYDPSSGGQSFPCGHATTGFLFFAFYFLLRRHRPGLARAALFASLSLGGLIGVARMTQGGHYASDVVWAAAVCWFVSLGLYHAMGLDRGLARGSATPSPMPRLARLALGVVGAVLVVGILLASPYSERRSYALAATPVAASAPSADGDGVGAAEGLWLHFRILGGEVEIGPGEEFGIHAEAHGHGFPTSKIGRYYGENEREGGRAVLYAERRSGWFRELVAKLQVEVPWERTRRLRLESGAARVRIGFSSGEGVSVLALEGGEGTVVVDAGGARLAVRPEGDPRVVERHRGGLERGNGGLLRIELAPGFGGSVEIVGGEP